MALIRCFLLLTLLTATSCEPAPPVHELAAVPPKIVGDLPPLGEPAPAVHDTPIGKVIKLITDLRDKVKSDGEAAATVYTKFAEDCKAKTQDKSETITQTTDDVNSASANLADFSSQRDTKETQLAGLKAQIEKAAKDLDATTKKCASERATNEATNAHVDKTTHEVSSAIKHVCGSAKANGDTNEECTKAGHSALLQKAGGSHQLHDLLPENKAVVAAMMQGQGKYADLSAAVAATTTNNDLISVLVVMLKDFQTQKSTLTAKMETAKKNCEDATLPGKAGSFAQLKLAKTEQRDLVNEDIQGLVTDIGTNRGDLVKYQTILADADEYMKDLTTECQSRAKDWDQRSSMRNDEVNALQTALDVLTGKVQQQANTVNQRVMFQIAAEADADEAAPDSEAGRLKAIRDVEIQQEADRDVEIQQVLKQLRMNQGPVVKKPIALLRERVVQTSVQSMSSSFLTSTQEARKTQVLQQLAAEGQRLGSLALVELAQSGKKDAFSKIKQLIDKLIQRLIHEATSETTKQAFCDGELTRARKERDYRWSKAQKLSSKIEESQAHVDALKLTCDQLANTTLPNLAKSLKDGADLRKEDKDANLETLKTGKGGLSALQSAMKTLKDFYNKGSKASFIQAPPNAIFGLLQTIESDFQRTIRKTEASEKQSARDWVVQSRDIAVSTSENEASLKFSTQELVSTKADIKMKLVDLTNAQGLLDNALAELKKLAPTCIDSGMSYDTKVAKREAEMKALQSAICQLDESGVEEGCGKLK